MALTTVQIKKALRMKGLTYEQVGAMATPPVSVSTIYKNIRKLPGCISANAQQAIARAIDMSVEDVFGDAARPTHGGPVSKSSKCAA
jgi:hypothetical protein